MYWMMSSVGTWLKDWIPTYWSSPTTTILDRMGGPRVAEALLSELTSQMRLAEERDRDQEQEKRRSASGGVDYGWLVMAQPKPYTLPEMERLDLESLCARVTPEESSQVMRSFRKALLREPTAREMPGILRAVIRQTMDSRPVSRKLSTSSSSSGTGGSSAWLSRSVVSLRALRRLRVNAVSAGSEDSATDVEMQSCDSVGCSSADEFRV